MFEYSYSVVLTVFSLILYKNNINNRLLQFCL